MDAFADIDAGYVTNLANATGSFNNKPIIPPQTIAIVLYNHPTNDRGLGPKNGGYGGCCAAFVPVPMIYGSPMYDNELYGYGSEPLWVGSEFLWVGSEPYEYGSEPSGKTEAPNSDFDGCKAKVSSSKSSKDKLSGSKAKSYLSKHKQKNHSRCHKASKNQQV